MKYDPAKHHRHSVRLLGYDYSRSGPYFVTICINQRQQLLGEIHQGEMHLNSVGNMVQTVWQELPLYYPGVELDRFILMPNHLHGIVVLENHAGGTIEGLGAIANDQVGATTGGLPLREGKRLGLGDVVHRFKSLTTAKYRHGVEQLGWMPFDQRLWQRNYYEHIIRDESSLQRIRQYIVNNPLSWQLDQLHPDNPSKW
jgi:REP element-mobilizing transposase RayT